jgi:hypothetical protein
MGKIIVDSKGKIIHIEDVHVTLEGSNKIFDVDCSFKGVTVTGEVSDVVETFRNDYELNSFYLGLREEIKTRIGR